MKPVLCAMINMFLSGSEGSVPYPDAIRRMRENGFDNIDLCLSAISHGREATEFGGDDWEKQGDLIIGGALDAGARFPQVHLPYPRHVYARASAYDEGCELNEWFQESMRRAIILSARAGVKWAVMHPLATLSPLAMDRETDIAYNHQVYAPFLELADKLGVGVCFENLCDQAGGRRFGAIAGDLVALVQSFGSDNIGVCWDFGHANRMYHTPEAQQSALRSVSPYLHATHVDDNYGAEDLHMPPFQGKVKWMPLMRALGEMGYQDAFTLEIRFTARMPERIKDISARMQRELGEYMISLMP